MTYSNGRFPVGFTLTLVLFIQMLLHAAPTVEIQG